MPRVSFDDETELMRRIAQKEDAALRQLYEASSCPVYSLALQVLQNADYAEEVMQDVFLKVWEAPDKWDENRGTLMSWLLTVTRYAAIDRLRQEKRHTDRAETFEDREFVDDGVDVRFGDKVALNGIVSRLPDEQAQVINLAYYKGMTHQEISDATGVPLGTVKTRIRLGMEKLRAMWLEQNAGK